MCKPTLHFIISEEVWQKKKRKKYENEKRNEITQTKIRNKYDGNLNNKKRKQKIQKIPNGIKIQKNAELYFYT